MGIAKAIDRKGRISLGAKWAGRHAIVEEVSKTEVRVILARVVPEREAWLHEDQEAMGMVQDGLRAARAGKFAKGADLDAVDTDGA